MSFPVLAEVDLGIICNPSRFSVTLSEGAKRGASVAEIPERERFLLGFLASPDFGSKF
jgi:hypothetical protein